MQTVFEFGDAKLRLKDIDPLYYALHKSEYSHQWLCAYTFAFVSFDLAGLACQIMDNAGDSLKNYWPAMHAAMDQTKRGAPRRYFRGEKGHEAIDTVRRLHGSPAKALSALKGTFWQARDVMLHWPLYGPTAYFKMADMAERVCSIPIDFDVITMKELMSNVQVTKGVEKAMRASKLASPEEVRAAMERHKWATKAGPDFKRKLNMQEFETILCYYSHDDAHQKHWPGDDVHNIAQELRGWGGTAEELIGLLPGGTRLKGKK